MTHGDGIRRNAAKISGNIPGEPAVFQNEEGRLEAFRPDTVSTARASISVPPA